MLPILVSKKQFLDEKISKQINIKNQGYNFINSDKNLLITRTC